MVKFMKKYKKWLLLFSIIGAFIPVLPCEAKVEQTHEVELIDMGHGIWIPSSFDVLDENGNFVTLSNVDASFCEMQEIDEESYSITLENGYRAEKEWCYLAGITDKAYPRTTIYDENGKIVFTLGNDFYGQMVFAMQDEDGNYVKNTYSRNVAVDLENDTFETYYAENEDGSTIRPLSRQIYNSEDQVKKVYKKVGNIMQLNEKYEYDTEGGGTCTIYGMVPAITPEGYDEEDEYYESFSYQKDDLKEYTYNTVFHIYGQGRDAYGPCSKVVPSKITDHGQELYIHWLDNYFTDVEWSDNTGEILDGNPMQQHYYFTQEQIEIIKAEGITTVDKLKEKYPEFLETFKGFVSTGGECEPESEEQRKAREAQESIIKNDVSEENLAEPEYDGTWQTLPDGTKVCWQELTGDVIPINGMIPKYVMTQELQTPSGPQISIILNDENYNMLMPIMNFDTTHTNYKYVYLTRVDFAINIAEIAGTNEPVSGNLNYSGETTYDTENGQVTGNVYDEYYYGPPEEY